MRCDVHRVRVDELMSQELSYRAEVINVDRINKQIGVVMTAEEMASRLTRMCLDSEVIEEGRSLRVRIPPTRADILHGCCISCLLFDAHTECRPEGRPDIPDVHPLPLPLPPPVWNLRAVI